jgi:cystathionine beta-lyase family protein involved in aluminum resistance
MRVHVRNVANIFNSSTKRVFCHNKLTTCYQKVDPLKTDGHIYVVKEREFIKTKENIYKIGRSKNIVNRMPSYPKSSIIYTIMYVKNVKEVEKFMIDRFDGLFIKRTDIGNEYYECDENELMRECSMIVHSLYLK